MNEYERLRRQAEGLRSMYPPGTRVECLCMNDPFAPVPSGTKGSVMFVDDIAQIHVNWDNGSSLPKKLKQKTTPQRIRTKLPKNQAA